MVNVAFLAIRTPHRLLDNTLRVGANILYRAGASSDRIRLRLVADQPVRPLTRAIRARLPMALRDRWSVHSTRDAPAWAALLHRKLCARGCQGPVCDVYMLKPLLHLFLPLSLDRVIFLDSDVYLFSDITLLWQRFNDLFAPAQLMALAPEENDFSSQRDVVARGGISVNGGVEMLHLARMRDPAFGYTELLWRYARRDPLLPLNGERGLGIQGEQVLYSWMSIKGSPGHAMVGRLPCSWNMQVASWPSHVSREDADSPRRRCVTARNATKRASNRTSCHLLHGAGGEAKSLMARLLRDPSGRSCASAFNQARKSSRHYPPGSPSEALFLRVRHACCAS